MVVHTSLGVFSPRTSLQNHKGRFRGSKLISSNNLELLEPSTSEHYEVEPLSAAKCRVYKRPLNKVLIFIAKKEQLYIKLSTSLGFCFEIIQSLAVFQLCRKLCNRLLSNFFNLVSFNTFSSILPEGWCTNNSLAWGTKPSFFKCNNSIEQQYGNLLVLVF